MQHDIIHVYNILLLPPPLFHLLAFDKAASVCAPGVRRAHSAYQSQYFDAL